MKLNEHFKKAAYFAGAAGAAAPAAIILARLSDFIVSWETLLAAAISSGIAACTLGKTLESFLNGFSQEMLKDSSATTQKTKTEQINTHIKKTMIYTTATEASLHAGMYATAVACSTPSPLTIVASPICGGIFTFAAFKLANSLVETTNTFQQTGPQKQKQRITTTAYAAGISSISAIGTTILSLHFDSTPLLLASTIPSLSAVFLVNNVVKQGTQNIDNYIRTNKNLGDLSSTQKRIILKHNTDTGFHASMAELSIHGAMFSSSLAILSDKPALLAASLLCLTSCSFFASRVFKDLGTIITKTSTYKNTTEQTMPNYNTKIFEQTSPTIWGQKFQKLSTTTTPSPS